MTGIKGLQPKIPQIFSCAFEPGRGGIEKMEAANNTDDPCFTTDFLRVFGNIADTGMRAAGDDDKPCIGPERKGRIVKKEVRFHPATGHEDVPFSRFGLLEGSLPGYFTQKDQIIRNPDGAA
jgi:hypothetical protein